MLTRHLLTSIGLLFMATTGMGCAISFTDDDDETGGAATGETGGETSSGGTGGGAGSDFGGSDSGGSDFGGSGSGGTNPGTSGAGGESGGGAVGTGVEDLTTIGVGVSADSFCSEGSFTITIQPRDAEGALVDVSVADLACTAELGGTELECTLRSADCTEGSSASDAHTVVLVILDDSGSMNDNDPEGLRGEACQTFVGQLGDSDIVTITDFGNGGSGDASALRTMQEPTSDKALAEAACSDISPGAWGTPIYGSVVDAIEVFYPEAQAAYGHDVNFSVLMVSDGEPDSDTSDRATALAAATQAGIPIYTVGLGPAAEGSETSDPNAVSVLQELSEETGGAYASAADAEALDQLFEQVGTVVREGSCQLSAEVEGESFTIGEVLEGTVVLEGEDEQTGFSFSIPTSTLATSRCQE